MSDKIIPATGRSGLEIDRYALQIIKQYQPKVLDYPQPFDVEAFFEFELEDICGLEVGYGHLPLGVYGVTDSQNKEVIVSKELMDSPSQLPFARSTIAHECGHSLIHVPEFEMRKQVIRSIQDNKNVALAMYRKEQIPTYRNPEWQAHHFSGALLMPECTVRMAIRDLATEEDLMEIYGVTGAFVRSRLKALKIKG